MPIQIAFRRSKDHSPFRELLTRVITSPVGDSLLLCSAYIWEPPSRDTYKILDDGLLDAIKTGCSAGIVVTVAGKLSNDLWKEYYRNFVIRLYESGVRVQPFVAPRMNWHAKIAVRISNGKPVAALIGSSNLTGPAYRLDWHRWNFESDVLIWRPDPELDSHFQMPKHLQGEIGNLHLILDPAIQQLDEEEQMQVLYTDILEGELEKYNFE